MEHLTSWARWGHRRSGHRAQESGGPGDLTPGLPRIVQRRTIRSPGSIVIPRYEWEPEYNRAREALSYGEDVWFGSEHAYSDAKHRDLRQAITERLAEQIRASY